MVMNREDRRRGIYFLVKAIIKEELLSDVEEVINDDLEEIIGELTIDTVDDKLDRLIEENRRKS